MSPEVWGVVGTLTATITTGIVAILVELIRNSRNTRDVRELVTGIKERLDAHIKQHENERPFIYLRDRV